MSCTAICGEDPTSRDNTSAMDVVVTHQGFQCRVGDRVRNGLEPAVVVGFTDDGEVIIQYNDNTCLAVNTDELYLAGEYNLSQSLLFIVR